MRISITIQTPEVPIIVPVALINGAMEEKFIKARQWGADGVELMTTNPRELDVDTYRLNLRKSGLEVSAIASGGMAFALGLTLLHRDSDAALLAKSRLYELIDFANSLNAPLVTIGSFRGRITNEQGSGIDKLKHILYNAACYAQARSIRLVLEPINRYETNIIVNAAQGLDFVREIGHPSLGLLLDTFHVNIEESSWTAPFRCLMDADILWHVHLGDNNRLPPGKGLIDFSAIITTLKDKNYQGYLSAELLPQPDPDTAASQTIEFIRALLEQTF